MTCSSRSWFWNKTLFLNNCSQYHFSYLKNMAGNLFSFCKSSTNDMNRSAMLRFSFVIESFTVKWSITAATCEKNELIIQVFAIEGAVMQVRLEVIERVCLQWNPSCEATLFAPEKWPFKRGGLSSGVEINAIMFRFTLSRGLSEGVTSRQGGLSKGAPLYISTRQSVTSCLKIWFQIMPYEQNATNQTSFLLHRSYKQYILTTIINFAYKNQMCDRIKSLHGITCDFTALDATCVTAPPIWLVLSEPH